MGATMTDGTIIFYDCDPVCLYDTCNSLGDHDHCGALHPLMDCLAKPAFCGKVQCRSGIIQNQNLRFAQKCSGNGHTLLLSTR